MLPGGLSGRIARSSVTNLRGLMVKRRRIPPGPPDLRRRQDDDCSARQLGGRKGLICEGASFGGSNPSGGHCLVDGGLPRGQAETRAFDCAVVEWLNRDPVCSPPGRCLGCGGSEHTYDKLLPYGTEQTGHAWLHSRCREARHANRKAKAVAILSLTVGAG